jgi:hypothetical protein
MSNTTAKPRKTYFGLAALAAGIATDLFLGANIGVSYLRITPETFNKLNYVTTLLYCILTPLTVILGVIGHVLKNDSKVSSRIAIILVTIPFLVLFVQLLFAIRR